MPNIDPLKERVPLSKKLHFPFELFRYLPVQDADVLQEELQQLYYEQNPGEMQRIIERGEGNPDLVENYRDEEFNKLIITDYGYEVPILSKREGDLMAQRLVEELNDYNVKVERQQSAIGAKKPEATEVEGDVEPE